MPVAPSQDSAAKPFSNLVVIELGSSVSAPFAGQILGELGAQVIKVEKADGDDARKWGPPFWHGAGAMFQALNRNKQSVVCDLRSAEDVAALKQLIQERAHVVLQNLRPGQVEKLGLDGRSLLELKPSLVYCNMGAFGSEGPLRDKPGYDPLMQAFGGIMSTTGEPGRSSVRVAASIVDMGTGMWATIGILAALHEQRATGKGKVVDVSLFETAACWTSLLAAQYLASGTVPGKEGSGMASVVPYRAFATSDGEMVVAAGSNGLFRSLAAAVGRSGWTEDPRFIDNPDRVKHKAELYAMLEEIFARDSTANWLERLEAAGIPCAPVQNLAQMLAHPQTQALGLLQPVPGSDMQFVGLPLRFDGQRPAPTLPPPALGEHTDLLIKKQHSK